MIRTDLNLPELGSIGTTTISSGDFVHLVGKDGKPAFGFRSTDVSEIGIFLPAGRLQTNPETSELELVVEWTLNYFVKIPAEKRGEQTWESALAILLDIFKSQAASVERSSLQSFLSCLQALSDLTKRNIGVDAGMPDKKPSFWVGTPASGNQNPETINKTASDIVTYFHPVGFHPYVSPSREIYRLPFGWRIYPERPEVESSHDALEALKPLVQFYKDAGPVLGLSQNEIDDRLSAISSN